MTTVGRWRLGDIVDVATRAGMRVTTTAGVVRVRPVASEGPWYLLSDGGNAGIAVSVLAGGVTPVLVACRATPARAMGVILDREAFPI